MEHKSRLLITLAMALLPVSAFAGGTRDANGRLEIPITVEIRQFDTKKIEVNYRGKTLILPMKYVGLPKDFDPRPDQSIQIRFSLTNWSKFSDKVLDFRLGNPNRIDLTEDLE